MLDDLNTKEWILTNGLGSIASGTVADIRTRTYHGWLFAAKYSPCDRYLLLSHLEASLELPDRTIALGANFWASGQIDPTGYNFLRSFDTNEGATWTWGENEWQLSRQLVMPNEGVGSGEWGVGEDREMGKEDVSSSTSSTSCTPYSLLPNATCYNALNPRNAVASPYSQSLLIQYRYQGDQTAILRLRLLIADRDFHHQQIKMPELEFLEKLGQQQVCLQAKTSARFGTPWHLRWTHGDYQHDAAWYWNYVLPEETKRGLSDREDLYSPGYLSVILKPGDAVTLEARVGFPSKHQDILTSTVFKEAIAKEGSRGVGSKGIGKGDKEDFTPPSSLTFLTPQSLPPTPYSLLLKASDQFIVYRKSTNSPTIIAGYHWFDDWGRDTLIALPGLALVPGRYELAKELLQTLGQYCRYGLIPDGLPDFDREPFYNSIDVSLWWIETLGLYLEATHDWDFLAAQYPVVQQIYKAFIGGTRYNIQVDSTDGLVGWNNWGVALTWMNAVVDGQPVTPRRGKPVEINALWYSALCWASRWAEILSEREDITDQGRFAKQARRYSLQAEQVKFSLQKFWNTQSSYLYDVIEPDDRRNLQIRPNAVLALSLSHCAFPQFQGRQVLDMARRRLLTPYGLRSLDPADPEYIGQYGGNQQQRDRAYHQGTVWCWLIGAFVRAWQRFYPQQPLPFDWQPLLDHLVQDACIGSISEIFDGDAPHLPRGAVAQAWSVAEVLRHIK
jgi:glycogen debranching enzyme